MFIPFFCKTDLTDDFTSRYVLTSDEGGLGVGIAIAACIVAAPFVRRDAGAHVP